MYVPKGLEKEGLIKFELGRIWSALIRHSANNSLLSQLSNRAWNRGQVRKKDFGQMADDKDVNTAIENELCQRSGTLVTKRLVSVPNVDFSSVENYTRNCKLPKKLNKKGWNFFISGYVDWDKFSGMKA